MKHETAGKEFPVLQADGVVTETPPTSGLPYTLLDTAQKVRIIGIGAQCTWTVQPTPLEVHINIDGRAETATMANPVTATPYCVRKWAEHNAGMFTLDTVSHIHSRAFMIEGTNIEVLIEITGGTVSNLTARIKYQLIRP